MRSLKKITTIIIAVCFAWLCAVNTTAQGAFYMVQAKTPVGVTKFEETDVLEDLRSDENFDIKKYPFDKKGELTLVSFNEYCYSFYEDLSANYGLYLYLYNPQALNIDTNSAYNRIQMAVSYNENGQPIDYENFTLKFCSVSTEPDYYRLFYKFKVIDHVSSDGLTLRERVNSNERRYDVSGVELITEGSVNAIDYGVSKTFYFSGYVGGYGPDPEYLDSTLTSKWEELETVKLNVHHTYWRSESSSKGQGYQYQLNSVYFSVPKRLFEEYGKLQRIKAEWWEYRTKDIVVTSSEDIYNAFINYVGVEDYSELKYALLQDYELKGSSNNPYETATWAFNKNSSGLNQYNEIDVLYYLFGTKNWCDIDVYDPYADVTTTGGVRGNELQDYMREYTINNGAGDGSIKDGYYSSDLFADDVDEGRNKGYTCMDIDVDEDLLSWDSYNDVDHDFWEKLSNWFSGYKPSDVGVENLKPIEVLDAGHFALSNEDLAKDLYINYNDVSDLRNLYNSATNREEEEVVVLFRYALTDYYSAIIDTNMAGVEDNQAYRAWQSVFLDFNIIQLTFNNNGVYTVIPVIANPIDIVSDITSPTYIPGENDGPPWWVWIIIAIIALMVLIVLIKFGPEAIWLAVKGLAIAIFYIITSPYWIIQWIVKKIKGD